MGHVEAHVQMVHVRLILKRNVHGFRFIVALRNLAKPIST